MGWTTSLYFTCFFILCLCLCRLASLLSVDPNESQGCIIFCSIMSAWMNLASLLFLSGPPFLILLLFFFGAPSFEIRFLSSSFAAASPSSFSLSLSLSRPPSFCRLGCDSLCRAIVLLSTNETTRPASKSTWKPQRNPTGSVESSKSRQWNRVKR